MAALPQFKELAILEVDFVKKFRWWASMDGMDTSIRDPKLSTKVLNDHIWALLIVFNHCIPILMLVFWWFSLMI